MVEALATIMSHFSGEANRARCLAHIVNLVAKRILRQFDIPRKEKNNKKDLHDDILDTADKKIAVDEDEDDNEEVFYKEEREMDDGDNEDDEDGERLQRDADIMEEVMEGEIDGVVRKVKPVRQGLFKVSLVFSFFYLCLPFHSDRIPHFFLFFLFRSLQLLSIQPPMPPSFFFTFNSAFIVSFSKCR